jgi:hypothetical protein
VFQSAGVILECRMAVSLGEVPGITGLGTKRKVGETELRCQPGDVRQAWGFLCQAPAGMGLQYQEQQPHQQQERQI